MKNLPMLIQPFGLDTISDSTHSFINLSGMTVYEVIPQVKSKKSIRIIPGFSCEWIIGYDLSNSSSEFICIGACTSPTDIEINAYDRYIGVRFDESGSFFNFGLDEKTYPVNILNQVFSYKTESDSYEAVLVNEFKKTSSLKDKAKVLTLFLNKCKEFYPVSELIIGMNEKIKDSKGLTSVRELSEEFGYSERHINRLYNEVYGFGPKDFARYVRFQNILKAIISKPSMDNGSYIDGSGYADLAHFQREFKSFTLTTPGRFIKSLK